MFLFLKLPSFLKQLKDDHSDIDVFRWNIEYLELGYKG